MRSRMTQITRPGVGHKNSGPLGDRDHTPSVRSVYNGYRYWVGLGGRGSGSDRRPAGFEERPARVDPTKRTGEWQPPTRRRRRQQGTLGVVLCAAVRLLGPAADDGTKRTEPSAG